MSNDRKKPVVVFLGDSLTEYMPQPALGNVDLRLEGYSGVGVDFLLRIAGRIMSQHQPDMVWLCIGINDVWGFEQAYINPSAWEESFAALCRSISAAKPQLYISTLMPVENFGFFSGFNLNPIREMNAIITRQAKAWGAHLLDSYHQFADEKGYLPSGWSEDGVHLTAETYGKWVPFICAGMGLS
jgi:lysophospholipase L1-like esterase